MAFKFVVFLASLAVASAGYLEAPVAHYSPASSVSYSSLSHAAPLAYAAPLTKHVAYASPAIGATHESTIRGHDATISHQSKAIDTAFSSVRKSDTRITNEGHKLAYAAPALTTYSHAPAYTTYASAPVAVAKQVSYAAPAYHAPAYTSYAHAAPAVATYSHAAPVVAAHATKTLTYSPAVEVAHVSYDGTHAHYGW
ncbi:larval/pupal cuticle protein H1C-like [Wyeomyia smithii]|uniref:larval/pupal cuticle protein H1C-like n=1 Tax=Wyeomyia smithii TaxID=174621 RepID=UPI002467C056|nr:larval/pupal cuticle protein H1C-like [Wyeomyia smithii]